MKASDYQDIGQYLRESRESLKVTRAQAATALHIRAKYLAALETGDLNELPGKAYIMGYIRNYAEYLQLDVDEVLSAYGELLAPRSQELLGRVPTLQQNMPTNQLLWFSLGGFILLYTCWYFIFHDRSHFSQSVSDVPSGFTHLLDKHPPDTMDKSWQDCLDGSDEGCYTTLKARMLIPNTIMLYDINSNNSTPQEP